MMTPLLLDIVMHYYYSGADYRDGDYSAPAVREGFDWLRDDVKLIEFRPKDDGYPNTYRLTERGQVYVKAVLAVPLPVQMWAMPATAPDYNVILHSAAA